MLLAVVLMLNFGDLFTNRESVKTVVCAVLDGSKYKIFLKICR